MVGGVVSMTCTTRMTEPVLPALSDAVHVTLYTPTTWELTVLLVTLGVFAPSMLSNAEAPASTYAVVEAVASNHVVELPIRLTTGPVVSAQPAPQSDTSTSRTATTSIPCAR